jgi:hypothetical protein
MKYLPLSAVFQRGCSGCIALFAWVAFGQAPDRPQHLLAPTPVAGLAYTNEFFPGTVYRPEVPTQQKLIGFATGARAASPDEVEQCLKAWATAAADRTKLVEYARSHEGRPLHYLVVTAPKNLAKLDEIQAGLAKLADPRKTTPAESAKLIDTLPAVAWLAYTIHGDETEGSDAALALLYHLAAARDARVEKMLEDLVIIIDPLMNPDGRARFLKMVAENRGAAPNLDEQSLVHGGYWPQGRGNHYLFDLNRDWILGVHPESRGRIREVGRWNPQLFVDAHGMGAQETHLFSPPRQPVNPNLPKAREAWGGLFAREQAQAFDRHQLVYYTGEWHEEWYPGYSDAYASYRGAIGILYEQARIAEDGVRRPGGRILSYRESVQHHVIGNLANLATLQANAKKLREHFHACRQAGLDPQGPYASRTFAILPTANHSRLRELIQLLQLEGIEVYETTAAFNAPATDQLGRAWPDKTIPAGTVLVPNRQPLAHLVAGMLEFDPHFSPAVLEDERKELLTKGNSKIYDTTAWNLTMFYGLESLMLKSDLPANTRTYVVNTNPASPVVEAAKAPVAYVVSGADDLSVTLAGRLMEAGVQVRVADKDFQLDGQDFPRGSIVATALDNRANAAGFGQMVRQTAMTLELSVIAIGTGLGEGDLPDLGGRHFRRLEPPRIALAGREGFSPTEYGSTWLALDKYLGLRHSHLGRFESADLARYNVLILPSGRGSALTSNALNQIKEWVKAGGTLIAIGDTASAFIAEKAEFSKVRALPEALPKLADYELAVLREWMGRIGQMPAVEAIWDNKASTKPEFPWQTMSGPYPEEKELRRRDAWQSLFMPQGAFLAARIDTNHWLTVGCGEPLPALAGRGPILMAADGVEAPIRFGFLVSVAPETSVRDAAPANPDKKEASKETPRAGWSVLPTGTQMYLRMSGLLWPEAGHRLANSAWVTREGYGRGQVVLFASNPTFRGTSRAMMRSFLNAVVYGPGCGTTAPVIP